jgi:DNA adenine methylase
MNPILRWAGGKRAISHVLAQCLPKSFGTYYEPMVGSGALFFNLAPKRAVLADVNAELINFYRVIQNNPHTFFAEVQNLTASKRQYYNLRASSPSCSIERAVRFFYLVRLSWNGLYRVNRQGQFNVPFGGRRPKTLIDVESLSAASLRLRNVQLVSGDFERTTRGPKIGDLVYFDPPYPKGATNGNGFARYSRTGFATEDHKRLANYASRMADKGVHVVISEAARKEILKFFSASFRITLVRTSSMIAAAGERRGAIYEAILTSY